MARMAVASARSRQDEAPTDLAQDMDALPRESLASQSLLPWKTSSPRHAWLSSPRFIRLGDIDSWAVDPEYNADRLWPEWGTGSQVIVQKSEQALRISAQWISDVLRSIDLSRIQATSTF